LSDKLTHLDPDGRVRMVDVGDKAVSHRVCIARGAVRMSAETLDEIVKGRAPKGDVLATARLAGIQAAKRTDEWIPLCHSIPLDSVELRIEPDPTGPRMLIEAQAQAHSRTGVEMEALVAVSAAALTIYDMCKAMDRGMVIEGVHLAGKRGGKTGDWQRPDDPLRQAAGRRRS
jgi:cyclic pyranopterin monophosphate synthase